MFNVLCTDEFDAINRVVSLAISSSALTLLVLPPFNEDQVEECLILAELVPFFQCVGQLTISSLWQEQDYD